MRLEVGFQQEGMVKVAQKSIRLSQRTRCFSRHQFVLNKFFQARQGLWPLQERLPASVKELQHLNDEFNFPNSTMPEFNVVVKLVCFDHFFFKHLLVTNWFCTLSSLY